MGNWGQFMSEQPMTTDTARRSVREILMDIDLSIDLTSIEARKRHQGALVAEALAALDAAATAPVESAFTADERQSLNLALRHAEKHQSAVFYDLDAQWPAFVSARVKLNGIVASVRFAVATN